MHFQIFVSGEPDVSATLEKVGLAHLATEFDAGASAGPDGHRGALFRWVTPQSPGFGFRPDEQTWTRAAADGNLASGRYYIGLWHGSPPTPRELARRYQQPGETCQLGDGNSWLIPRAQALPKDIQLADDGSLKFEIQRQFHAFFVESERWRSILADLDADDPDGNEVDFADLWNFSNQALVINYRITPEVVSSLKLLPTSLIASPMLVSIGAAAAARSVLGAGG